MTRLSATATIAALLLLAIVQGFGATSSTKSTKSSPKVATKSTAKPYHVSAQNQFHIKSTKHPSKALARFKAREQQRTRGPQPLGTLFKMAAPRTLAQRRAVKAHKNQTNPPTGKIGFISATQISAGGFLGDTGNQVLSGTVGTSAAFITVVDTGGAAGCAYSEVVANGDGTFTTLVPASPATLTLVPDPVSTVAGDDCNPYFVVGDVNGDGNSDIVQADVSGATVTISTLLSNGDGTFTAAAAGLGPGSGFTLAGLVGATGGTLVPNATSGFLDLWVVDDSEPSNLAQFAGNGDGTFTLAATPGVSVNPPVALTAPAGLDGVGESVIIEDLDGDGVPDVAENDFFDNQVSVYLSNQTAPYTGVALATPDSVYDGFCGSTTGTLTGSSGLPAIVETNCEDNTITVYNNAAGVFSEGVYYPSAATPSTPDLDPTAVTVADVNGDGNGDVVVTNSDTSDVTVLLGNGDGTLQLASMGYATGGFPYTAAIVMDLNGDGLADILVADSNQSLVWMAGYGDGSFQASKNFYSPILDNSSGYSWSIASGDVNGDGFADVVVSNFGGTSTGITVFLSNPDGSLQPGVNYASGGDFDYVTVSDFNGDGNLDIAANNYAGYLQIFTGTGSGTFIEGPTYSTGGSEGAGIVAGAFNNSTNGTGVAGFNDLAVYNFGTSNISVLVNDGSGGFLPPVTYPLSGRGQMLATAQLTTSGNLDLAAAEYEAAQVGVLLGNGDGTFAAETTVAMGTGPFGIALADVSGDGIPDIVATDDAENILVATGKGDGTFPNPVMSLPSSLVVSYTTPFYDPNPWAVQVADVDGDGVADLVYTNWDFATVGVIFGQGTGTAIAPTFFDPVEFPTTQKAFGLTVADVNGDGSPDAIASDANIAGAGVLINGNGTAAAPNFSLAVSGQSSPAFLNIPAGGTATAMITLTPVNFYSGTVTFSCGGLPLDVTCAFAPATLTPVGNAPLSTTLTVTTAAAHGALRIPADSNPHQGRTSLLACLTGMGLFGLLLSGDWKNKRNRRVGILLGLLVLGMMFSLVGCSSSSTPGTPIGAQTIQVIGTGSDGTTNSVNITINVF